MRAVFGAISHEADGSIRTPSVKATYEDMNLEQRKKMHAMSERIRKYYRQMDGAGEPFSFMGIAEDLLRVMDELAQELGVPLRAVQKLAHYCA